MTALITGLTGFAGSHLAELLLAQGERVVGIVRGNGQPWPEVAGRVTLYEGDAGDRALVGAVLERERPDAVYHLAAQPNVAASFVDPEPTYRINILTQLGLLQGVLDSGLAPRILIVGSQEEYGRLEADAPPATEDTAFRPLTPYAVSKIAQDMMGLQYFQSHGLPIVRVRPAGHTGPRQSLGYVAPDFACQIAEIECGRREPALRVGNLSSERDLTDVRDVVRAYHLALTRGEPGEVYNVGRGQAVSIQTVLDLLVGMCRVPVQIEVDPARLRKGDARVTLSDATRLRERTGWRPQIPLEQTLGDTLEYWRMVVAQEQRA